MDILTSSKNQKLKQEQKKSAEILAKKEALLAKQMGALEIAVDDLANPNQFDLVTNALKTVQKNPFSNDKAAILMDKAAKLLIELERVWLLKKAVAKLDQKTIAELKSFSKPLEEIVVVMRSVFLLLGTPPKELKDWKAIKIWIGKTGKDSLKRRIANYVMPSSLNLCSVKNLTALKKAKTQLDKINVQRIQDISIGTMVFYSWVYGTLDELELDPLVANV